jgi:outer membrane protein
MNNTKTLAGFGLLALCCAGPAAAADSVYGNEIRAGIYIVQYDTHADDITGPFVPKGVNLNVNNVNTAYVAYIRRLSPNFVLELAAGVPPKTETVGKGPATLGSVPFNGEVISTAKWLAPTLLLNYVFFDESATWRPYFGVGANYTKFYDRQSTAAGNAANGGPTAISLSSSLGPAATLGVRWHLQDRWSLYASYSYSVVRSNLTANTAGVIRRTHIDFNPTTLVVAVGFAF